MPLTPADIRNTVLLGVATFAAALLMPALPYVGLPLAAFALGWISFRYGLVPASVLAVVASLPVLVFGTTLASSPLDAGFVAVALLAAGPGSVWALRRFSAFSVVGGVTLIVAGVFLVSPIGATTLQGSLDATRAFVNALAASGSIKDPASLRASIPAVVAQMAIGWPSSAAYLMGIGALAAIPLVGRAGRSLGQVVNRYPALADIDVTFHLVWPAIAGLALVAAGTVWGKSQGPIYAVGYNTLIIVRPALVLQGFAVFAALYRRIGAGRVWRTIGFVLLAGTEWIVPSVSVLGVADMFFNFRKLSRHEGTLTEPPA
jgi:hypothetical protein